MSFYLDTGTTCLQLARMLPLNRIIEVFAPGAGKVLVNTARAMLRKQKG